MPHHEYLDCLDMQETSVAELRKALFEQGKRLAAAEAGASAVLARIAWTLQENQQSVDVLTQKLISAEQRAERLAGALRDLLGFCAPLMRLTAGNDEQWENAVREARAALDDTAEQQEARER